VDKFVFHAYQYTIIVNICQPICLTFVQGVVYLEIMEDVEKRKEVARKLAWATYLDILQDPKVDAKVRREAAKDVLESVGDLVKAPKVMEANQFVLNVPPEYIAQAAQAIKGLLGDRERNDLLVEETQAPED